MTGFNDWMDGLTEAQIALQYKLSCLADGELNESAAAQVLAQIESDPDSRAFFDEVRRFARLHRDVLDPDRITARVAMLSGEAILAESGLLPDDLEAVGLEAGAANGDHMRLAEQQRRLASIFYQLGKAYVLSAMDFDRFREQVFEAALPIRSTKDQGRGFVDAVLREDENPSSGQRFDNWAEARGLFNGRLERIEDPIEKGIKLLEQALEIETDHEEARIYLAFVHGTQGRTLKAERLYKEVFDTAVRPENRGHAAMQIGQLYTAEGDHKRAAHYYRWVTMTGLAEQDSRFWPAYFNLAIASLGFGRSSQGLFWLRELLNRFPERAPQVASLCLESKTFRASVEADPKLGAQLTEECPELFSHDQNLGGSDPQGGAV